MARRRFGRRGSYRGFRGRGRRSRGHSSGLSMQNVLMAGAIYGVARPYIASALPTFFNFGPVDSDNVILGGGGYLLSKKSSGLMKALGLLAMGTEAGIVTSKLTGRMLGTGVNQQQISQGYTFI